MSKEEIYPAVDYKTSLLKVLVEARQKRLGLKERLERVDAVMGWCEGEIARLENHSAGWEEYQESVMEEDLPGINELLERTNCK